MFFRFMTAAGVAILLLTGCSGLEDSVRTPLIGFGDIVGEYHFDSAVTSWDTFRTSDDAALVSVSDGALVGSVAADRGYVWSLNQPPFTYTSIKAQVQQTRGSTGNGFGILCRADEKGNGYYFVLSSAGQFAILKALPDVPDPVQLVKWQPSGAVKPGDAINSMEVICVDDYLSLTANGVFIAEARDPDFKSGHVGVVLGAVQQSLWVHFDDIIIHEVRVIGG